jgi:toxin-antitoxin system PIN domain toxin
MSFFLDVNILLYASDSDSPQDRCAQRFLNSCIQQNELFCLGWPTVMSYLRIATHPSVFDQPLTPQEAMANIETLQRLPHARFLSEQEGFWDIYCTLTAELPVRGNLVPDAHLAAIHQQHGVTTLYTHDRDFRKFGFLNLGDPAG